MYKNILVCYDGSENGKRAIQEAPKIAKASSTITILQVISSDVENVDVADSHKHLNVKENFAHKLETYQKIHPHTEVKILNGLAAKQIIQQTKSGNYDLVIVGSRGLGGIKKHIFGSVSSKVLTESPIPVLVVK